MFNDHVEGLAELEGPVLANWMLDLKASVTAIQKITNARRVNLAILGNAEPHLHAHLIPRIPDNDPIPSQSPWNHPLPVSPLDRIQVKDLVTQLQEELAPGFISVPR
jgi:diadenosine tetraphosphate (Ap4A) HIT family hydrolase